MILVFSILLLSAPISKEIRLYDTIKLTNGSVLRGLIQSDSDRETLTIALLGSEGKVSGGVVRIPRSQVAEIIPRQTPLQIYREEVRKRDVLDSGQLLELAQWCGKSEVGLYSYAVALAHRVLRLDPTRREVYPLLEKLLARKALENLTEEERDFEIEVALRAQENGVVLPQQFLRAAQILYREAGPGNEQMVRAALGFLLEAKSKGSEEIKNEALSILARIHLDRGDLQSLSALLEECPAEEKLKLERELVVRLLNRGRPEDIDQAEKLIADLPEGVSRSELQAAVSFFRGDLEACRQELLKLVEKTGSPEIVATLGVVLSVSGKEKTAGEIAKLPELSGPDAILLRYLSGVEGAAEKLKTEAVSRLGLWLVPGWQAALTGDKEGVKACVDGLRKSGKVRAEHEMLAWVLSAIAAFSAGDYDQVWRNLLYARAAFHQAPPQLDLSLAALNAWRRDGSEARRLVAEASRRGAPPQWVVLVDAYAAYCAGRLDLCERLLGRLPGVEGSEGPFELYVRLLRNAVWEARCLETWEDRFERADSQDVLSGWLEDERYGVQILLRNQSVVFSGRQAGAPDSITLLYRFVDWGRFYRLRAVFKNPGPGTLCGLFCSDGRSTLRLEVAPDGKVYAVIQRQGRSEERKDTGAALAATRSFELGIQYTREGKLVAILGRKQLDLGKPVRFSKRSAVRAGVFAGSLERGGPVEVTVNSVRLWRLSAGRELRR